MTVIPPLPAVQLEPALDQLQLFTRGLEHLRRLAGVTWSDHNLHDPGITLLELLCYALTDLGYRALFPIEDLLTGPGGTAPGMATAARLLPNEPLSELDFRKLLIDLPGIKNAWLLPAPLELWADLRRGRLQRQRGEGPGFRRVEVRGRWRVRLDFQDAAAGDAEKALIVESARTTLEEHRNLGEAFVAYETIETQSFVVCAEVELATDADTVRVEAGIRFALEQYLDPAVFNYSLAEMLERRVGDGQPLPIERIFTGPRLRHGFIDDEELLAAELRQEVRLSDVIALVMGVPGVLAVRDLTCNPIGRPPDDRWRMAVAPGRKPILARLGNRLVFYKRGIPLVNEAAQVDAELDARRAALRAKLETPRDDDLPIPRGRGRQLADYVPLRSHLPAVYGVGPEGLPANADPHRQALAAQLRAFLLFFDQVLANGHAQLAGLPALFDPGAELGATNATRQVEPGDAVWAPGAGLALPALAEDESGRLDRHQRLVDHLLARHAEPFRDYVETMRSLFGTSASSLHRTKVAFLAACPELAAARGRATRRTPDASVWDTDNVSGLERRLGHLLGFDSRRRNLAEVPLGSDVEITGDADPGFRFRLVDPASSAVLLSSNTKFATEAEARTAAARALELALRPRGFSRRQTEPGEGGGAPQFFFNVVEKDGQIAARRIQFWNSPADRDAAINQVIEQVQQRHSREGLYLIENLLLLPEPPGEEFFAICVDPNCHGCADDDPYSYRLHVVLPADAGRFADMEFRRFTERVIREETPAHLLPKICWANAAAIAELEVAFRAWLEGAPGALATLVDVLTRVKNVYPTEKLRPCGPGDPTKFLLGRTALGSSTA